MKACQLVHSGQDLAHITVLVVSLKIDLPSF